MKHLVTVFILSISFCWAQTGRADLLQDISPEDEKMLRQTLPQLFKPEAGLPAFDEAIRILVKTGRYENVYVYDKNGYHLIGRPLRTVEAIQITGNSRIAEGELRELVEFAPGERFDRKSAVAAGEKIKDYYGQQGYFNAVVEIDFKRTEANNIVVHYSIVENRPCEIAGVTVLTANTDLKAKLERHFRKITNKNLTAERTARFMTDLESFLINNRYLATEVQGPELKYNKDKTKALIELEIKQPYRWEFYFEGYDHISLSDLYHALDLKNKERKNLDPANEGSDRLRQNYLAKGFANADIKTKVVNPKDTYLKRVYYTINEGPRVEIDRIEVQGRISRSSRYYADFIFNNSSPLVHSRYFNRADLENGFKNLVTELRNQGYLRAKILSTRIEFDEDRDAVFVQLLLDEGPQTQIRALDFEGNRFTSSYELAQVTGLQTNTPLRLNNFESSIENLKSFYRNLGFLEMRLLNEGEDLIQYNESGSQARIVFRIYEGPRIRINSIVVDGNTFTKTRVILKETNFKVGEILTPDKIDEATARLNKMGLFSRADIRTLEEGTNVGDRTLIISVSERDPGVFRFGAGVNNERELTVRGFTGLSYNNLWGTARGISGRVEIKSNVAQINFIENEVTIGYLEPFLFNTRTRGRVNLTRSERVFDYQSENDVTKIVDLNRADFSVDRDITRHTKFTWKVWSIDWRREFERYGRCIPDDDADFNPDLFCKPTSQQVALIGPALDVDYRDNPFLPTKGSFTRFMVDYTHPDIGSSENIEFVRLDSNYTHYLRLGSPRFVWANSVRGGYVANLNDRPNSGVPTSYAFFLGGIYTIRGFDIASDLNRIPKQGDDGFKVEKQTQILIPKDSHYYLVKTEMRFPIFGEHGGVFFYDGGAVKVSGYNFRRTYRDAVGFGYRYNTPVGPVALDFAFKLRPLEDEDKFRFHLSIGTF